jgi:hypothetical protein
MILSAHREAFVLHGEREQVVILESCVRRVGRDTEIRLRQGRVRGIAARRPIDHDDRAPR